MYKIECPCGEEVVFTAKSKLGRKKYCSKKCFYEYRKIEIWNKGLKGIHLSPKSEFKKGMIPHNKGKRTKKMCEYSNGYDAIHEWVERWLGKQNECEKCGSDKNLQWSNKNHKYKRVKKDWQRLCKKCHNRYDFEKFGSRKSFYN